MISVELTVKKDGDTRAFLFDVVNQRMRCLSKNGELVKEARWWKYKELCGQGKPGDSMQIVWLDGKSTPTWPVVSVKQIK